MVFVVDSGKSSALISKFKLAEATIYQVKSYRLNETIGYLALTCNLISCILLILVLRLVKKASDKVAFSFKEVQKKLRTNRVVTVSHILLITVYSVLTVLYFNEPPGGGISRISLTRVATAWTFFGGLTDIFITCMIWFLLDDNSYPTVFRHGNYYYAVTNVIKESAYNINYEEVAEEKDEEEDEDKDLDQ